MKKHRNNVGIEIKYKEAQIFLFIEIAKNISCKVFIKVFMFYRNKYVLSIFCKSFGLIFVFVYFALFNFTFV